MNVKRWRCDCQEISPYPYDSLAGLSVVPASDYDALAAENARLRAFIDNNMTFYNTAESNGPVLACVSKRIWYHATDDMTSYPFSAVIDKATAVQPSGERTCQDQKQKS